MKALTDGPPMPLSVYPFLLQNGFLIIENILQPDIVFGDGRRDSLFPDSAIHIPSKWPLVEEQINSMNFSNWGNLSNRLSLLVTNSFVLP
jgi:hypothetical protein